MRQTITEYFNFYANYGFHTLQPLQISSGIKLNFNKLKYIIVIILLWIAQFVLTK
jgi:hypothetical protein